MYKLLATFTLLAVFAYVQCLPQIMIDPMPVIHENVQNQPFCSACELIIQFAEREAQGNKTEAAIVKTIEKVCGVLPPSLKPECVQIVDTYGPTIVNLLVQAAPPQKVCQFIKLC